MINLPYQVMVMYTHEMYATLVLLAGTHTCRIDIAVILVFEYVSQQIPHHTYPCHIPLYGIV